MRISARRAAAISVVALAAAALTVPLAAPASASTSVEYNFFLTDSNDDGTYGLWKRTTPDASPSLVAESTSSSLWDLSVSRDGTRFAYTETTYDSAGDPLRDRIVVRDVSGRLVRVVDDLDAGGSVFNSDPVLSPDGGTVVFSRFDMAAATPFQLRKVPVAAGASTVIANGYVGGAFVDASTVLTQSMTNGNWYTVPLAGGAPQAVAGAIPSDASGIAVSPDGAKLAWSDDTSTDEMFTSDVQVADLVVAGGVATVSGTSTIATGLDNTDPSFSRDGAKLFWVKWDGDFGPGDVWSSALVSGTPAATPATSWDEVDVAVGADDATAPAPVLVQPGLLNPTSITLRWTLPADADLSGVLITCKDNQNIVRRNVFVPAPLTSYVHASPLLGNPHLCTYTVYDRSGNVSSVASKGFVWMPNKPSVFDPTSTVSTKATFPVVLGTCCGGNAYYYVDYLKAGTTTWKPWITGATAITGPGGYIRIFGSPASTNILATTSTPGSSYTFRVKVKDYQGNYSAYVTTGRAVVPFDQTKATLSGGANVASTNAYMGSSRKLYATSHSAKVTLTGNRLQVVGMKCPSCGKFSVYDNGTLVATIDSYSSSTKVRQVLYTRTYSSVQTHTLVIKPKATAGRPNVYLDAFAARA